MTTIRVPEDWKASDISVVGKSAKRKKIAVVGAGAMGRGIAQIAAMAGLEVVVFDRFQVAPQLLKSAQNEVWLGLFLTKNQDGKLTLKSNAAVDEVFARITWVDNAEANFSAVKDCEAVIEAIFEDIEVKKKLYQLIENNVDANRAVPIFTNTSTIQICRLADGLQHPERFMGMHFFNPVPLMKPIELIPHNKTSNETIFAARELTQKLGKEYHLAPDLPGFVVNRLALPMIVGFEEMLQKKVPYRDIDKAFLDGTWPESMPALKIVMGIIQAAEKFLEEQKGCRVVLSENQIDDLMEVGINMPMGPFKLKKAIVENRAVGVKFVMGPAQFCDLVGLDVALDCCKMLKMQEPDKWALPATLETMIAAGKRGRKTGEGFYQHAGQVNVNRNFATGGYVKVSYAGDILSASLVEGLRKVFVELRGQPIKGVVLEVQAKGANIKEFPLGFHDSSTVEATIQTWHALVKAIHDLEVPVIAVVRSHALGGGYELALACDYIVATANAVVGLPEVGLGILPGGGGTQNLTRRVGWFKSLKMILSAGKTKATKPWVDQVAKLSELQPHDLKNLLETQVSSKRKRDPLTMTFGDVLKCHAMLMFLRLAWKNKMPTSSRLAQDAILEGNQLNLRDSMPMEARNFVDAIQTKDAEEGIRAFLEKRKPNFKNQ